MKKVAVVVLNWNGRELLEQFLPTLIKYTSLPDVELVVADNASTDTSVSYIKSSFSEVRIIELEENFGFAEGYNRALKVVKAEYFVLLNSDVEVTEGWLEPMIKHMEANREIVAAQPKILSHKHRMLFEYAGAAGGYIDSLGFPFCRGRIFDLVEEDKGQYDAATDVFWASGACMLVRAKDYFEDGGFDPRFFAHMEEIDLCWRWRARGKRIVCLPQSRVYHVGGATLGDESARKVYLNFRNNMLMLYKNLDECKFKKVIGKRLIYNKIAALKFYLSGHKDKCRAVLQAHKDFEDLQSEYLAVREENLRKSTVKDIPEIYNGNIVLDYYLKGKKRYSALRLLS